MGQPFRFIHCGDLHLGAPFSSLTALGKWGEALLTEATYTAFSGVVTLAIEERVDAVLISGDIYNSADHNLEAQVRFVRELERLSERNIPVFIVHGNHDPVEAWSAKVPLPQGVYSFPGDRVERVPLVVRHREVAAIYGISHAHKGIFEDLTKRFRLHEEDTYAIGLLHASIGGFGANTEYAPTTVAVLQDVGMDYWALGHIHKRQIVNANPYIVYAGNTQGLSRKEQGPKGCYLVSVGPTGTTELTFKETCALVFDEVTIDIGPLKTVQELEEMLRHKKKMLHTKYRKPVLAQVILTGEGPLAEACHEEETRALWLSASQKEEHGTSGAQVILYRMVDETALSIDLAARRELPDVLGDYLAAYDTIATLEHREKMETLREILEKRPEVKRLGSYSEYLTEELLTKAFARAEREGARYLLEEDKPQ